MTTESLDAYGMVEMTDEEVAGHLASQRVGVLGLPTDGAPAFGRSRSAPTGSHDCTSSTSWANRAGKSN